MDTTNYLRQFMKYVSLNVLGMMGLSFYILADTFFISKGLGANGLTALNLAIPVYNFIHGSGLMLGMGGAVKYAIARGEKRGRSTTDKIFTNTILVAAGFAMFFVVTGLLFSGQLTALLGADETVFAMTHTYIKVMLLFSPAYILNDVLLCFVRNDNAPNLTMFAMLGGSLANIVLDYIFIFPMHMGIFGAILATGFAPLVGIGVMSVHFLRHRNGFGLTKISPNIRLAGSTLSLGFPSLITELSSGIVIIAFNMIILKLNGNVGVAAYGVVANLSLVVAAIYTGIAQGMQPLVSTSYGYCDDSGVKRVFRYTLVTVLCISCFIYLVIFFGADVVAGVFNSEQNGELQRIATDGLRLYFTAAAFLGMNIVSSVFFMATERPVPAHIISLLRGIAVIIPMVCLLSYVAGITGVWLAFPATEALVCAICTIFFCINGGINRKNVL